MSVMIVRSKVKPGKGAEVEEAARKMFAAIEAEQPDGVRYASCKLTDGETFLAVLELRNAPENPLAAIPAFTEFQAGLKDWLAESPVPEFVEVVGSYRLFGA